MKGALAHGLTGAVLAIFAGNLLARLGYSPAGEWLQRIGLAAGGVVFCLRMRAGYLRRRPYWTPQS